MKPEGTLAPACRVLRLSESNRIQTQKDFTIVLGAQDAFKSLILHPEQTKQPKDVHFNLTGCILGAVLTTEIDCSLFTLSSALSQ
jgi:hypothetical protein